ncbi:PorV/PorQ family protein [Candidatus Poribacteria bacterium]|nr:PorV/PorQ family protein [Candidatus Poribacteria bacterium]
MPRYNRYFILVILCAMTLYTWTVANGADIHENAGTRAMAFLKIGVGARAIGMGESQVADAGDLYASYWNPAGLAKIQRPQLGLMHNEWFEGINHEFLGFVQPLGNRGAIGGSVIYLSFGELQGRDAAGLETKKFRPYDLALILSYAHRFSAAFSVGANAKWLREQIDTANAQVIAFDIGGLYAVPNSRLTLGFNAQHLGTKATFVEESFNLPVNIKVGVAYKLLNDAFTLVADVNRPSDNDITIGFGVAFTISQLLHLRTGYKYTIGGNDLGVASGIASGIGFTIEGFQIDYAFASFGKLGPVHRISLTSSF